MNTDEHDDHLDTLELPTGWSLIDRVVRPDLVILEFRHGGRFGPKVTGLGGTVDEAVRDARKRMLLYDEPDRPRGVR